MLTAVLEQTLNGLMAIPNLVAVLGSIPLLLRLQREFFAGPALGGGPRPSGSK